MKKKVVIILTILLLLALSIILYLNHNKKFYLDDKFYNEGTIKDITLEELNESISNNESFILYTYNNYCNLRIPCGDIFKNVSSSTNITFYSIKYEYFKESTYHEEVSFAPSVLIINKGKIVSYLDSESDKDLDKYQDETEFKNWLEKYIYLSK